MTTTHVHPLAGTHCAGITPGERPRLVTACYVERPDADNPEHRVRFGTSGHRGSSLALGFNEEALRGRA